MRCNKRRCPLKVDRWTNRFSPRRVSFRKMRSEQYSVYEIQNDRVHRWRYSRIEHVKGKSNSRTTHAVLNKCKCCAFDDANLNLGKRKVILKVEIYFVRFVCSFLNNEKDGMLHHSPWMKSKFDLSVLTDDSQSFCDPLMRWNIKFRFEERSLSKYFSRYITKYPARLATLIFVIQTETKFLFARYNSIK